MDIARKLVDAGAPSATLKGSKGSWKTICKTSDDPQGFAKSTKVLRVPGGRLFQTCTTQRNPSGDYSVSEALAFAADPAPEPTFQEKDAAGGSGQGKK